MKHPCQRSALLSVATFLFLLPVVVQPIVSQTSSDESSRAQIEREQLERELRDAKRELAMLKRQLRARRGVEGWVERLPEGGGPWADAAIRQALEPLTLFTGRARLGLSVRLEGDEALEAKGALIESVVPDGPAAKAGLRAGDVVLRWNDQALGEEGKDSWSGSARSRAAMHLTDLARALEDGDEVRLKVERDGKTLDLVVVAEVLDPPNLLGSLGDKTAALDRARALANTPSTWDRGALRSTLAVPWRRGLWSDLEVVAMNPDLGAYFGTDHGLLVLETPDDELFGLKAGDVILAIGDRKPHDMTHAVRILDSYEVGETINLEIMRNGSEITLTATMPDHHASLRPKFRDSAL